MPDLIDNENPSALVKRLADPASVGWSVKAAINSAASRLSWKISRVRDVWYDDKRISLSHKEFSELKQAVAEAKRQRREIILATEESCVADELRIVRKELVELRHLIEEAKANGMG